jgi:hypothetical protein
MQHTYYIIYKTTDTLTGEYYIGQHRTNNLQDGYKGSGNWIRLKQEKNRELVTEILHYSSKESLCSDEAAFIGELWITDPYCMNQCPGGGSGPHKDSTKKQISETRLRLGLKPDPKHTKGTSFMYKDDVQRRVPTSLVNDYLSAGWCMGRLTKPPKHTGKVWITKEDKQIRVDNPEAYLQSGWSIGRVSLIYTTVVCPHCNKSGGINVMKRWHLDRCKFKK